MACLPLPAQELALKADTLAGALDTRRCYVSANRCYDPRFLVFEFVCNMVMRGAQVNRVRQLQEAAAAYALHMHICVRTHTLYSQVCV